MIFWVDDRFFLPEFAHDVERIALLRNAANRGHSLFVSQTPEMLPFGFAPKQEAPAFCSWWGGLQGRLQSEVRLLMERLRWISVNAVTRGAERIEVYLEPPERRRNRGLWQVDWSTGVRIAGLPLFFVVENIVNDAVFLQRCMPPEWRERFELWQREGWLRFEHGGGLSGIEKIVRYFGNESEQSTKRAFLLEWKMTRAFLFDHDGKQRSNPSDESLKLSALLSEKGLEYRYHRLRRREQESYLPAPALEALYRKKGGTSSEMNKYKNKKPEQRWYSRAPNSYKNSFGESLEWQDSWFEQDGSWDEMREIAEMIAAAM